jgi:hypothetical protein
MQQQIRRAAVKKMITSILKKAAKTNNIEEAAKQIAKFKAGEITANQLMDTTTIANYSQTLKIGAIMNISGGKPECGIIALIGCSYKSSITYYGNSIVEIFKIRYYLPNGSILSEKVWKNMQYTSKQLDTLLNYELIDILLTNLRGARRRRFVSGVKNLIERDFPTLDINRVL